MKTGRERKKEASGIQEVDEGRKIVGKERLAVFRRWMKAGREREKEASGIQKVDEDRKRAGKRG